MKWELENWLRNVSGYGQITFFNLSNFHYVYDWMLELLDFMKFKFRDRKFILCQIENVGNLFKMIRFVSFFCSDVVTNDQIRSIFGLLQLSSFSSLLFISVPITNGLCLSFCTEFIGNIFRYLIFFWLAAAANMCCNINEFRLSEIRTRILKL